MIFTNKSNWKLLFATLVAFFLLILSWRYLYQFYCVVLVIPVIWGVMISQSILDIKIQKRLCFRNCFFKDGSFFFRVLSSKFLISIFSLFLSLVMVLTMMYEIIVYEMELLVYMAFHIYLAVGLFVYFHGYFNKTVNKEFHDIFVREWTVKISAIFFFIVYALYIYNGYEPVFLDSSVQGTISSASNSVGSNCVLTDYILRLKAEIDSLLWWGTDQSTKLKSLSAITWTIFIFINSFAILGLNRFIVQCVFLINKVFNEQGRHTGS